MNIPAANMHQGTVACYSVLCLIMPGLSVQQYHSRCCNRQLYCTSVTLQAPDLAIPWTSIRKYRYPHWLALSHTDLVHSGKTTMFIEDKALVKTSVFVVNFPTIAILIELQLCLRYLILHPRSGKLSAINTKTFNITMVY
jgi:hypothetical protein